MITKIQRFGEYAKVTFRHSFPAEVKHGQVAIINNMRFAIAEDRGDEFDIFVKKNSSLLTLHQEYTITGPTGDKFYDSSSAQSAIVIAGGTGIGAVCSLIKERRERKLPTQAVFFARGDLKPDEVLGPYASTGVKVWNTLRLGRPESPLSLVEEIPHGAQVYVAGPMSLVNSTKLVTDTLRLECHTNF